MSGDNTLSAVKQQFERQYQRARYQVMLEQSDVTLSIGNYDALAEQALRDAFDIQHHWVILTPCNPRSVQSREEMNNFYLDELRYALDSHSGTWGKAINFDPHGEWPDEPGFFVVDPVLSWMMDLGRRFGQNAVVHAELGQAPRLLWLV